VGERARCETHLGRDGDDRARCLRGELARDAAVGVRFPPLPAGVAALGRLDPSGVGRGRARVGATPWAARHPPRGRSQKVRRRRGGPLAWTAVAAAAGGFAASLVGWQAGGGSVDVARAPTLDLRLDLALDGLGALYTLLATGIGAVVFAYAAAYVPLHLEHERRPAAEGRRF
jgi:hypothetical protein